MQNRIMKTMLATMVGSFCLTAAAYAASTGSTSGSATKATPAASGSSTSGSATGTSGTDASANGAATGATTNATTGSPAASGTAMSAKYSDAEIVALDLTIDDNEIKAAQTAEKKKMGKDAMKLAKMLLKQHREDSNKVSKLAKKENITPSETASKVQELRDKGAADLQTLAAKDSMEFEQGYISAMVQGHTEALALFDEHLVKDASSSKLKKEMEEARKHVAHHLEEAKRLQGDRASR
jgi:putative membrane protein